MNGFVRHIGRHVRRNLVAYVALFVALSGSAIAAKPPGIVGDISAVLAGDGLSGGGTEGDVTLGLSSTGCSAGEVWTWSGSAWSCEAPTARAYALIRVPGTGLGFLDTDYSKNVNGIVYSSTAAGGGYCISLDFTPRNIQVTNADPGNPAPGAYLDLQASQCPVGYRAAAALANTTVWVLIN